MNIRDKLSKVISYKIGKFVDMNRIIISIELQDNGSTEATIIVKGERNNQILFEERFEYKNEEKHPIRLHLLKEQFMNKHFAEGKSLGIMSIRKLFKDITERCKSVGVPDYRNMEKKDVVIQSLELYGRKEIEEFFRNEPEGKNKLDEWVDFLLSEPNGFTLGLPSHYVVDGREIFVHRRIQEVVTYHI